MKFKFVALVLALTVVSWAQTATPSNSTPAGATKTENPTDQKAPCPCCEKGAAAKDSHECCHHAMMADKSEDAASCCSGKDAKGCCDGKDAKACMRAGSDKAAAGCCGKDGKGSCMSDKKDDKMAMACCGEHGQCGMHDGMHNHADMNK